MKIDSVFSQAMLGIQRGLGNARQHAAEIASAGRLDGDSTVNLVEPLVGLKMDKLQVQASTEVLKAYDEMIGSLFDDMV
jgi:hypothetical protein